MDEFVYEDWVVVQEKARQQVVDEDVWQSPLRVVFVLEDLRQVLQFVSQFHGPLLLPLMQLLNLEGLYKDTDQNYPTGPNGEHYYHVDINADVGEHKNVNDPSNNHIPHLNGPKQPYLGSDRTLLFAACISLILSLSFVCFQL